MGFHTFPKAISLKVSIIVQIEFELTYYNATVHHISHYITGATLEFSIENFAMLMINKGNRETIEGIELSNQKAS